MTALNKGHVPEVEQLPVVQLTATQIPDALPVMLVCLTASCGSCLIRAVSEKCCLLHKDACVALIDRSPYSCTSQGALVTRSFRDASAEGI